MSVVSVPSRHGGALVVPNPGGVPGEPGAPGAPGGNVMAVGLFTALASLSVPAGTTLIQTSGHQAAGTGHAIYVEDTSLNDAAVAAYPNARVKTANGRYFRIAHEQQLLDPHQLGCIDSNDGTLRDTGAALQAMLDYLHAIAINPSSGGGFYKGAAPIAWGRNHFHSAATTLEPKATILWLGCGSGRSGPDGGASSLLSWGANCTGVRLPFPTTTGDTGLTSDHDASASFVVEHMRWRGGFVDVGTTPEGNYYGFVPRAPFQFRDLVIENFQGEGIKAWAGTVTGFGSVGGNLSTSCGIGVKIANCRGGLDQRGSDANVVTWLNCEAYQNRQFGVLDDNGAGSNSHIGWHCASNGMISNVGVYTQTSTGGNRYALTPTGNPLNAPSGTTADTADWAYIEAGAAIANLIPAYAATPGLFRFGGDYVTLNNSSSKFDNCYSEYGGFSFFSPYTRIDEGTIGDQYFRGGIRINARSDGLRVRQSPNATLRLQHRSTQVAYVATDEANVDHSYIVMGKTFGNDHLARDATGHRFFTAPYGGSPTLRGAFTTSGVELPVGHAFFINGLQVLTGRQTGCPAAATDLASALTLVNFLRTAGFTHGHIG